IRESILHNLKQRFREAGVTRYNTRVLDVAGGRRPRGYFDIILCDAPCTGSGTWGRTPEQLYFFTEDRIAHYVQLQRRIAREASRALKRGGYFLYITCSVFQEENESVVAYLQEGTELKLVSQQYHSGYTQKADTLFSALFTLQPDHPGGTQQPLPLE
ncbi:MAG TPA: Fmu (Sun) domain protein, partial [Chitinophagaceae bacterium]|nr:Fmu (Sun) domain protein [Chitinophagaceae bacterium]